MVYEQNPMGFSYFPQENMIDVAFITVLGSDQSCR